MKCCDEYDNKNVMNTYKGQHTDDKGQVAIMEKLEMIVQEIRKTTHTTSQTLLKWSRKTPA